MLQNRSCACEVYGQLLLAGSERGTDEGPRYILCFVEQNIDSLLGASKGHEYMLFFNRRPAQSKVIFFSLPAANSQPGPAPASTFLRALDTLIPLRSVCDRLEQ
jgi:hypothetical protein